MRIILALISLLFVASLSAQQTDVFELVVTNVTTDKATLVGDTCSPVVPHCNGCTFPWPPPQTNCRHLTYEIPISEWSKFANGKWPDRPVKGRILKGSLNAGGWLEPVASCTARRQEAMAEYCKEAGYDCARTPANAFWPEDCSRYSSEFILETVKRANQEEAKP